MLRESANMAAEHWRRRHAAAWRRAAHRIEQQEEPDIAVVELVLTADSVAVVADTADIDALPKLGVEPPAEHRY